LAYAITGLAPSSAMLELSTPPLLGLVKANSPPPIPPTSAVLKPSPGL